MFAESRLPQTPPVPGAGQTKEVEFRLFSPRSRRSNADEQSRRLLRKSSDTAGRRMYALKQVVKRELPLYLNDQFAIEEKADFRQFGRRQFNLRKISREVLPPSALFCSASFVADQGLAAPASTSFWFPSRDLTLISPSALIDRCGPGRRALRDDAVRIFDRLGKGTRSERLRQSASADPRRGEVRGQQAHCHCPAAGQSPSGLVRARSPANRRWARLVPGASPRSDAASEQRPRAAGRATPIRGPVGSAGGIRRTATTSLMKFIGESRRRAKISSIAA